MNVDRLKLCSKSLLVLGCLFANLGQASPRWFSDEVHVTPVSGYPGSIDKVGFGGDANQGVRAVTWGERNNKPCDLGILARNLDGASDAAEYARSSDRCNATSIKSVEFDDNPRYFVRGIATCGSKIKKNEKRIKGIKIIAAKVWQNESRVDELSTSDADNSPNCQEPWHDAVYCESGWVASGVDVHRDGDSIVGIALRCRQVGWGSGAVRPIDSRPTVEKGAIIYE